MRNRELTQEQKKYREFDKRRNVILKIIIGFLIVIVGCFMGAFCAADENPTALLLCTGILVVYTVIIIFICRYLTRKQGMLYAAAYGNDASVIRTGLFGELWKEFEWNSYEGLTDGRVVFAETHNNMIDLQIIRNKHEFCIEIDCESVCMICDEETDDPIEKEMPLSDFQNVGEVFLTIREFMESNS